jgi:MOSC domain-containing protein YiiM
MGKVEGLYISKERGIDKRFATSVNAVKDWGLEGDAHAGDWDKQVSIFPIEAMEKVPKEKMVEVEKGGHTENITISGVLLEALKPGTVIEIGTAKIKILYIGKEVFKERGRSYIVSREGRFGIVLESGVINVGDKVLIHK